MPLQRGYGRALHQDVLPWRHFKATLFHVKFQDSGGVAYYLRESKRVGCLCPQNNKETPFIPSKVFTVLDELVSGVIYISHLLLAPNDICHHFHICVCNSSKNDAPPLQRAVFEIAVPRCNWCLACESMCQMARLSTAQSTRPKRVEACILLCLGLLK